jgi:hypothetical protein
MGMKLGVVFSEQVVKTGSMVSVETPRGGIRG